MATKPVTTDVSANAQYLASIINGNFSIIEDAIEGCLGRGGTAESPNSMEGPLDMNLSKIQNLPTPTADKDAANKKYVDDTFAGTTTLPSGIISTAKSSGNAVSWDAVNNNNITCTAENYSELQGLTAFSDGDGAIVLGRTTKGDGGGGAFFWDSSDLSTEVTVDSSYGIYVPPSSDLTGASGSWVRNYSGAIQYSWFGTGETGLAAAATYSSDNDLSLYLPVGDIPITGQVDISDGSLLLTGDGDNSTITCTGSSAGLYYEYASGWDDHSQKILRDIRINGDKTNTALYFYNSSKVSPQNMSFEGNLVSLKIEDSYSNTLNNIIAHGDSATAQTTGIHLIGVTNTIIENPYLRDHLYSIRLSKPTSGFPNESIQIVGGAIEGNENGTAIEFDAAQTLYTIHLSLRGVYFERNGNYSTNVKSINIPSAGEQTAISAPYDVAKIEAENCKFSYTSSFGGTGEYDWGWGIDMINCAVNGYHTAASFMDIKNSNLFTNFVGTVDNVNLRDTNLLTNAVFRKSTGELSLLKGFKGCNYNETVIGQIFQVNKVYSGAAPIGPTNFINGSYPYYTTTGVSSTSETTPIDFGGGSWQEVVFASSPGSASTNVAQAPYSTEGDFRAEVFLLTSDTSCELGMVYTGASGIGSQLVDVVADEVYKIVYMVRKTGADGTNESVRIYPTGSEGPTVTLKPLYSVGYDTIEEMSDFVDAVAKGSY